MNNRTKQILKKLEKNNMSEVARDFNVSRQRIHQIKKREDNIEKINNTIIEMLKCGFNYTDIVEYCTEMFGSSYFKSIRRKNCLLLEYINNWVKTESLPYKLPAYNYTQDKHK